MFFLCNIASLVGVGVFFLGFARWGVVFSFLASLVGVWCFSFFASLVFLSSRVERSVVKGLVYIHATSEAMCPPGRASPASVEEREEKSSIFR